MKNDQEMVAIRQHAVTSAVTLYDGSAKPIHLIMEAARIIEEYVLGQGGEPAKASK